MGKTTRKTPDDYRAAAAKFGFNWIDEGGELTVRKPVRWRCSKEHEWLATYANIVKGHGCPYCSGNIPKTLNDYYALAQKRGFEFVDKLPSSTHNKATWRCDSGHEWQGTYSDIAQGHGCPRCAHDIINERHRITTPEYHRLAASRGFAVIGVIPASARDKTEWQCSYGHKWQACYHDIKGGNGCPYCVSHVAKVELDYHMLAFSAGYSWLGSLPKTTQEKTLWRCDRGHEFQSTYSDMKSGKRCPKCWNIRNADRLRLTPADYRRLARRRGLTWLGVDTPSVREKTPWRCHNGHEFLSSYNSVQSSKNCPLCEQRVNGFKVSQPQIALQKILGGKLNYRCGRYAIDIALNVSEVNIAVEYDCWYWHDEQHDTKRDAYLINQGWRILHIKSGNLLPSHAQLEKAIRHLISGVSSTEIFLKDWKGSSSS